MMDRQDRIIAVIRTGVPALVGALLAFLIARVPVVAVVIHAIDATLAGAGLAGVSTLLVLQAALVAVVVAGYYWLARRTGARWPAAEKWLLGRSATPRYAVNDVTQTGQQPGEHVVQIIPGTTTKPADLPHYGS